MNPRRYWILLLALAALWGASYLFIKIGLEDMSPAGVVFARTFLAGLILLPLAFRRRAFQQMRGQARIVLGLAALQVAGPFLLISYGEEEISSSLAGILVATAPIFTALLAIRVDRSERSSGWRLVGVVIGIVGVALLLGVDVDGDSAALIGALMVVLASLGYALGSFVVKRRLSAADPVGTVAATMLVSAAMTLPLAIATLPSEAPGAGPLAAVAALGVLGTGVAFVIFYGMIARYGPARAALVAYIAPVLAVAYGVALLDEGFSAGTAAGLLLILAGSWLAAEGRRLPWRAAEPPTSRTRQGASYQPALDPEAAG